MLRGVALAPTYGVFFLLLLSVAPTVAQHGGHGTLEEEESKVVIPDPPNDVTVTAAGRLGVPPQNGSSLGSHFDHIDILLLVVDQETDTEFKIGLYLKSLTQSTPGGFPIRTASFVYGKVEWTVRPGACRTPGQTTPVDQTKACLSYRDNSRTQARSLVSIPMETKVSENGYVFTVEKRLIFNENRVPGQFGASLRNVSATATQFYGGVFFVPGGDPTGGISASDRTPSAIDQLFTFVRGSRSRGHLALSSLDPIRVSNGEATTIVYKVDLLNHNNQPMTVELGSKVPRPEWTVRTPALLKVDASSTISFPVILALPFTHDHGKTVTFEVTAQAVEDAGSRSSVELGVFWTDIPQPSAHHNGEQWFHSAPSDMQRLDALDPVFPIRSYWFNGIAKDPDPEADDANVQAFFNDYFACLFPGQNQVPNCPLPPYFRFNWFFPLSPPLLLGLDFDLNRTGSMVFDVVPKVPASDARITVKLLYCDPGAARGDRFTPGSFSNSTCSAYTTLLAQGTARGALSSGQENHFEVPLTIEPTADYIPYKRGHNIGVQVIVETDTPQNLIFTEPKPEFVTKKAKILLPLVEYHDPIDQAFQNVGRLALESLSPFEKLVNPGKTTVFRFDLKNSGTQAQQIRLEAQGIHKEWAALVGETEFELAPNTNRTVTLAVQAPDDAQAEERAELFLVAQNVNDAAVVAVTRLRATVVTYPEIEDESGLISIKEADRGVPGPSAFVLLVALALLALVRRRRA